MDQYADVLNYKKPFAKHFSSSVTDINSANTLSLNNLNFNPTIIKTYDGIIFEEITEDRGYAYTQTEKIVMDSGNTNIILAFYFFMQNTVSYNERHYKRFPDLFSELGGLGSFILLVASFVNYIVTQYIILLDTHEIIQSINNINYKNKVDLKVMPHFYRKASQILFPPKKNNYINNDDEDNNNINNQNQ